MVCVEFICGDQKKRVILEKVDCIDDLINGARHAFFVFYHISTGDPDVEGKKTPLVLEYYDPDFKRVVVTKESFSRCLASETHGVLTIFLSVGQYPFPLSSHLHYNSQLYPFFPNIHSCPYFHPKDRGCPCPSPCPCPKPKKEIILKVESKECMKKFCPSINKDATISTNDKNEIINKDNEKQNDPIINKQNSVAKHFGVMCDGCEQNPICGNRYKCKNCFDFDLCEICYKKVHEKHDKLHSFRLIDNPERIFSSFFEAYYENIKPDLSNVEYPPKDTAENNQENKEVESNESDALRHDQQSIHSDESIDLDDYAEARLVSLGLTDASKILNNIPDDARSIIIKAICQP